MPRILPRLVKLPLSGLFPFLRNKPPVPRKPVPPLPSALPADYARSALLAPGNFITNSHDYIHRKSRPPVYCLRHKHRRSRGQEKTPVHEQDALREMSAQERTWWSSPYLRMLATPVRQCFLTGRYLPTDLMIRLAPMNVPPPLRQHGKLVKVIFPDGLLHSKFMKRRAGRARYILCSREALKLLDTPKWSHWFGAMPFPRLGEQIAHLLRLRVLQELQLISKELVSLYRMRADSTSPPPPLAVRRLTRAEWGEIKTTGIIPFPGAIAVLVVPPPNRDPATKQRPVTVGAMKPAPLVESPRQPTRLVPPMCILHPVGKTKNAHETSTSLSQNLSEAQDLTVTNHPPEQVPLYNGVALFPGRVQRAKLHALLTKILGVQRAWRFSAAARSQDAKREEMQRKGDNKGSHAFLICSSDAVDMGALGVAFWRVQMWGVGSAAINVVQEQGSPKDGNS